MGTLSNVHPAGGPPSQAEHDAPKKIVIWHVLIGLLFALVAMGAFFLLADLVIDKSMGVARFDRSTLVYVRAHWIPGLSIAALTLAWFGNPFVMVAVAAVGAVAGLIWKKIRGAAWLMPIAVIGAGILIQVIKTTVHRTRPDVFKPLLHESGYSFPSGHSTISVVVYGLLGYFIMHLFKNHLARWLVGLVTVVLVIAISASRVYAGVHYPTDVLAGWAVGLPWMISCLGMHEVMTRHWRKAGEPVLEKWNPPIKFPNQAAGAAQPITKG